jgi:hypothetical protein
MFTLVAVTFGAVLGMVATLGTLQYRGHRERRALAEREARALAAREQAEQAERERARLVLVAKRARWQAEHQQAERAKRAARVLPYAAPARGRYVWRDTNGSTDTWLQA